MLSLTTIVDRFRRLDRAAKLDALLAYARKLPPLPEELEALKAQEVHRVPECMTPVYLWAWVKDGQVIIQADAAPEAPTVRGFLSLVITGLHGATPEDVARVPADLLDRLGLTEVLGMTRMQGLSAILGRIKREVAAGVSQPS